MWKSLFLSLNFYIRWVTLLTVLVIDLLGMKPKWFTDTNVSCLSIVFNNPNESFNVWLSSSIPISFVLMNWYHNTWYQHLRRLDFRITLKSFANTTLFHPYEQPHLDWNFTRANNFISPPTTLIPESHPLYQASCIYTHNIIVVVN